MKYFDLHCDTLYKATTENKKLYNNDFDISLDKISIFEKYIQFFAIWLPDELTNNEKNLLFNDAVNKFDKTIFPSNVLPCISIENSAFINSDLSNIDLLDKKKFFCSTLTWNGDNQFGSGVLGTDYGLTEQGKKLIDEYTKRDIVIDVSHASDKLFFDIEKHLNVPFIASHSNARKITNNKRNLTDDMIKVIVERNGLIGLNFYKSFLSDNPEYASIDNLLRHAEYILNLGAEKVLSIGSDFDGADMPDDINGVEDIEKIYNKFNDYFGKEISDNIFFNNADNFYHFL